MNCRILLFGLFGVARAKSHNFFIKQKSKFTEIFNICWKHVPFILCRSSQFDQMFYISVNFDFCIMKKLWDLAHQKLVNILGGHHVGTNIHGCQPYLKIAIYVLKSANGGLLCRPLYSISEQTNFLYTVDMSLTPFASANFNASIISQETSLHCLPFND